MKKRALITGVGGMDGSHLAELLLGKGYEVFGVERRKAIEDRTNIASIIDHNSQNRQCETYENVGVALTVIDEDRS